MKRRKVFIIILAVIVSIALTAFGIWFFVGYEERHELDGLSEENLLELTVTSNNIENSDERTQIFIDFEKGTIIVGNRIEYNGKEPAKEVALTEEQCEELREYIVEYSSKVKSKEKEYWPHSYEYPPMFIKFYYVVRFGDSDNYKEYLETGALCYPDDWEEFVDTLLKYYYN